MITEYQLWETDSMLQPRAFVRKNASLDIITTCGYKAFEDSGCTKDFFIYEKVSNTIVASFLSEASHEIWGSVLDS